MSASAIAVHNRLAYVPGGSTINDRVAGALVASEKVKSAIADIYVDRYNANTSAASRWVIEHPRTADSRFRLTTGGLGIGALVGGVLTAVNSESLPVILGGLFGAAVATTVGIAAAGAGPNIQKFSERRWDAKRPIERDESQKLVAMLRDMPDSDRHSVGHVVTRWVNGNSVGASASEELRQMVTPAATSTAGSRIAEAAAIILEMQKGDSYNVTCRLLELKKLFSHTPEDERYELANSIKTCLFDGDRFVNSNASLEIQRQIHDFLSSFNTVIDQ